MNSPEINRWVFSNTALIEDVITIAVQHAEKPSVCRIHQGFLCNKRKCGEMPHVCIPIMHFYENTAIYNKIWWPCKISCACNCTHDSNLQCKMCVIRSWICCEFITYNYEHRYKNKCNRYYDEVPTKKIVISICGFCDTIRGNSFLLGYYWTNFF